MAIAERRHRVAELYLQGWPQHRIAAELDVVMSTVHLDLKAVQKVWLESSIRNFDEARAQELAKLDRIEAEYLAAWERSKLPRRSRDDVDGVYDRDGNPSFLAGAERCVAMRCKLLGLDQSAGADSAARVLVVNAVDLKVALGLERHPDPRMAMEEVAPEQLAGPDTPHTEEPPSGAN